MNAAWLGPQSNLKRVFEGRMWVGLKEFVEIV